MYDMGKMNEEAESDIKQIIASNRGNESTDQQIIEVDHVPDSLKADYYYTLRMIGRLSGDSLKS